MKINIDRDMILVELYDLRSLITELTTITDEAKEAKKKLDSIITLISSSPAAENNQSFPKRSSRR